MKRNVTLPLLMLLVLLGAILNYTRTASTSSANTYLAVNNSPYASHMMMFATTFNVDRADDIAGATACTGAANDCSLRGAVIAANADLSGDQVIITLQPSTTYKLTLANATQENAAATGDLDITTTLHSVTIVGGGSSGPGASIIDASGLTSGNMRDRVFQVTASGANLTLQDLAIQNGHAADGGASGASTDPIAQNANRSGGGVLNNGGSLTLDNVLVQSCQAIGKGDTVNNDHTTLDAQGGGVASVGGTGNVVITGSTLSGNSAVGGNGGNFNNGSGSNAKGGSIYVEGGTLNVALSKIENSNATGGLGGSVDQNGDRNGGFGGVAQGGGLWIGGGTATINQSTFENANATGGQSGNGGNGSEPAGPADGGGIYTLGNLTVTNSTFHANAATGGLGGNAFGNTCLGGHMAGDGGGARGGAIFADGGTLIVNTATFASNAAIGGNGGSGGQIGGACGNHGAGGLAHGGAIANNNAATVNLKHGTLSLNNAQAGNTGVNQGGANKPPRLVAEGTGGGIRVGPGAVTVENTIIADNDAANGLGDATGAPIPGPDVDGAVTSNGHNLLGIATEATGFTGTGDVTGASPLLAALADNGGPTQTMALTPGSPAIDAGVASGSSFDQRAKARTYDDPGVVNAATSDGTDIGAFELQPECSLTCPTDIVVANDPNVCGANVTYPDPTGTGCGTVTCDHPSGSFFAVGETLVTCTSSVGPTCSFKVTVNDAEGPVITPSAQSISLWPPNHKYTTVDLSSLVSSVVDNCDVTVGVGSLRITSVTSDESVNGGGDGNTIDDIVIAADCKSVQLRAERSGNGNGRVYTINFKVTDSNGNTTTASAKVTVPKSQNGSPAVDDGPSYSVLSNCP